jgi:hypothetical protein
MPGIRAFDRAGRPTARRSSVCRRRRLGTVGRGVGGRAAAGPVARLRGLSLLEALPELGVALPPDERVMAAQARSGRRPLQDRSTPPGTRRRTAPPAVGTEQRSAGRGAGSARPEHLGRRDRWDRGGARRAFGRARRGSSERARPRAGSWLRSGHVRPSSRRDDVSETRKSGGAAGIVAGPRRRRECPPVRERTPIAAPRRAHGRDPDRAVHSRALGRHGGRTQRAVKSGLAPARSTRAALAHSSSFRGSSENGAVDVGRFSILDARPLSQAAHRVVPRSPLSTAAARRGRESWRRPMVEGISALDSQATRGDTRTWLSQLTIRSWTCCGR